jgi:hypothetical protein
MCAGKHLRWNKYIIDAGQKFKMPAPAGSGRKFLQK